MPDQWFRKAAFILAPVFTAAALEGCGFWTDRVAEVEKHLARSEAVCPAQTGEAFDAARHRTALESAYRAVHLERLNKDNVTVCLSRALGDAQTTPPYHHPAFGIYYPAADEKGAFLYLWDDGKPAQPLRPIMNEDSYIRHPARIFRGLGEILDGEKRNLKRDQVNIAIGDGGCGYNCTDVTWYAAEKQAEFVKLNPGLFPRTNVSAPVPSPAVK